MTKEKYTQVYDDEWVPVHMRTYRLACCDCGLVHDLKHRRKNGVLEVKYRRNARATSAMRRGFKFEKE